jgi:hypothetical protein
MRTSKRLNKLIPITESVLKVRVWERNNLPIEQSQLALDLFLIISYHTLIEKPLTLKQLFHSIDFSEAGIRKQLRRLLKEEWCLLLGDEKDKRLKLVVAQTKMLLAMTEYSKVLSDAYKRHRFVNLELKQSNFSVLNKSSNKIN